MVFGHLEPVVRDAGTYRRRKGGLMESEAFWINIDRETQGPARIADDFIEGLQRTTDVDRLRWKAYRRPGPRGRLTDPRVPGSRQRHRHLRPHEQLRVLERDRGLPGRNPELLHKPLRVTLEHDARWRSATSWRSSRTCIPRDRPNNSDLNWPIALLERSHTRSATRPRPSRPSSRSESAQLTVPAY